MNRRAGRQARPGRALRGIHSLPLPPVGEEPPAVDVRRHLPASRGAMHKRGTDAWTMQTQCLVAGEPGAAVRVSRPVPAPDGPHGRRIRAAARRLAGRRRGPSSSRCGDRSGRPASRSVAGGGRAGDGSGRIRAGRPGRPSRSGVRFVIPAPARRLEPLRSAPTGRGGRRGRPRAAGGRGRGRTDGARSARQGCSGSASGSSIERRSACRRPTPRRRPDARRWFRRTRSSACRGGEFVSLTDPPEQWKTHAAACRNVGAWPVLVGEEPERDTMLSSPDHPLRLPAARAGKPRRSLRRDGDRRNPHASHPDSDRRGEAHGGRRRRARPRPACPNRIAGPRAADGPARNVFAACARSRRRSTVVSRRCAHKLRSRFMDNRDPFGNRCRLSRIVPASIGRRPRRARS